MSFRLFYILPVSYTHLCTLCARVCPVHAITGGRKIPHIIDPQACIRCGTCMEKCKFGAIYVH